MPEIVIQMNELILHNEIMKMYDEDEPEKTFRAIDHIQQTISATMSPLQTWQRFVSPKVMNSFLTMLLNLFFQIKLHNI